MAGMMPIRIKPVVRRLTEFSAWLSWFGSGPLVSYFETNIYMSKVDFKNNHNKVSLLIHRTISPYTWDWSPWQNTGQVEKQKQKASSK